MDDTFKRTEGVLFNYNTIKAEITNLEFEIEDIHDEYDGLNGISYSDTKSSTNSISDSTFNAVNQKEKMINSLLREKKKKERLIKKIDVAIDSLNEDERKFVKYRYIENKSWQQVGALMCQDPNYCCNYVRKSIINKLSNLIFIGTRVYI